MGVSGFHLLVLGVLVSLGGLLLLAKRRWRPAPAGDGALCGRSTALREETIRHSEAMAGTRWLTIGGLALAIGLARGGETSYFVGFWEDIFLHVGVLSISWVATVARAKGVSRERYLPKLIELHREGFERSLEYLRSGGYGRGEVERGLTVSENARQRRLAEVTLCLDRIGASMDLPRREGERDQGYAERLRPFFEGGRWS